MAVDPNNYLDQIGSASSAGAAGSTSTNASDPPVWWPHKVMDTPDGTSTWKPSYSNITTRPSGDVKMEFYRWSDVDRNKWGEYLAKLGLIDAADQHDYGTLQKEWLDVVDEAANFTAAGKQIDPWQVAALIAGGSAGPGGANAKGGAAKSAGFTGSKSQTQKSVDLTDPTTAKALVNDVLSKQLGRNATPDEVAAFTNVLNNAERANPTTTTSTTTYNNGDAVSNSSTTQGGLDAAGKQQLLTDAAMKKPDYGAFQAATTYWNALVSAVQSPVPG